MVECWESEGSGFSYTAMSHLLADTTTHWSPAANPCLLPVGAAAAGLTPVGAATAGLLACGGCYSRLYSLWGLLQPVYSLWGLLQPFHSLCGLPHHSRERTRDLSVELSDPMASMAPSILRATSAGTGTPPAAAALAAASCVSITWPAQQTPTRQQHQLPQHSTAQHSQQPPRPQQLQSAAQKPTNLPING